MNIKFISLGLITAALVANVNAAPGTKFDAFLSDNKGRITQNLDPANQAAVDNLISSINTVRTNLGNRRKGTAKTGDKFAIYTTGLKYLREAEDFTLNSTAKAQDIINKIKAILSLSSRKAKSATRRRAPARRNKKTVEKENKDGEEQGSVEEEFIAGAKDDESSDNAKQISKTKASRSSVVGGLIAAARG